FAQFGIRASPREASRRFYTTLVGEPPFTDDELDEWLDFAIVEPDDEHPVTRNLHVAFAARSPDDVAAFSQRAVRQRRPRPPRRAPLRRGPPGGGGAGPAAGVHARLLRRLPPRPRRQQRRGRPPAGADGERAAARPPLDPPRRP